MIIVKRILSFGPALNRLVLEPVKRLIAVRVHVQVYNRHDGRTSSTPDADSELRIDDGGLSGAGPVDVRYEGGECDCVSCARARWFRRHNRPAGGGQRQGVGMGVDGDSQGTSPPVEEVPDLVQHTSATAHNQRGDRIELEKVCMNLSSSVDHHFCVVMGTELTYCLCGKMSDE